MMPAAGANFPASMLMMVVRRARREKELRKAEKEERKRIAEKRRKQVCAGWPARSLCNLCVLAEYVCVLCVC